MAAVETTVAPEKKIVPPPQIETDQARPKMVSRDVNVYYGD